MGNWFEINTLHMSQFTYDTLVDGHDFYVQSLPLLYVILVTCSYYGVIVILPFQKGISELKACSYKHTAHHLWEQLSLNNLNKQQDQNPKTTKMAQ